MVGAEYRQSNSRRCFKIPTFPRVNELSIPVEVNRVRAAGKQVNAPSKRLPLPNQASIMPVSYTSGQTAYGGFTIHHMYQHTLVFSRAIGTPVAATRVLEERAGSLRIDQHLGARRFLSVHTVGHTGSSSANILLRLCLLAG